MFFYSPKTTTTIVRRPTILAQQTQVHDQRLSVQLAPTISRSASAVSVSRRGRLSAQVLATDDRGDPASSASLNEAVGAALVAEISAATGANFDTTIIELQSPIAASVTPPSGAVIINIPPDSSSATRRSASMRRTLLRPQITISHDDNKESAQENKSPPPEFGLRKRSGHSFERSGRTYESYENYGYTANENFIEYGNHPPSTARDNINTDYINWNIINNNDNNNYWAVDPLNPNQWRSIDDSICWGSEFSVPPPARSSTTASRRRISKGLLWHPPPPSSSITATLQQQRGTGRTTTVVLRRPTITIQEDGHILIDHLAARWDGLPPGGGGLLDDGDDGATILTGDSLKEDGGGIKREIRDCFAKVLKYAKILTPHVILVSVLIGYLCFGAWILMILETKTELMARSRKLIRVSNLITNFTAESWRTINGAQSGARPPIMQDEWENNFREYILRISETIDDRRPIRRELSAPDNLLNLHNKWTFPTALLYVLTVLTTCGYGEVSVDTDTGKIFSVAFALVGIPLMFITAADIGKFLSETLLRLVKNWNAFVRYVKEYCAQIMYRHKKFERRKSAAGHQFETLGLLGAGLDGSGADENLWFPIGAYVSCICLYCSMGSAMFINWERSWSFIHAFHFGFNLIVTVGLGDVVVTDYIFLSLIVAFVIVGLSVVTMCVDLASTHLKAYFTRIHYFGRARRFLELSDELREIVALLGAMRKKKHGKVTWNDVRDFLDNELCDRPFEPHELLMKLRFIDETTSSAMSTIRHNSLQSDLFRDAEYLRRLNALRPEANGPAYL